VAEPSAQLCAVIFDWGGVITNPIVDTVTAWLEAERIDRESYMAAMRPWVRSAYGPEASGRPERPEASGRPERPEGSGRPERPEASGRPEGPGESESPIHALERGEMSDEEFEATLAAVLVREDGTAVHSVGLLRRMFGASVILDQMLELIKDLRARGILTSLLSNSWGGGEHGYPRHLFADLFDDVVISGEVGMRKPEERIFQLAATRLGLSPGQCVFVDDVEGNIVAAEELGFAAVHHEDPVRTRAALSKLFANHGGAAL
jgi:putative hydrolase of the HAD superfamily